MFKIAIGFVLGLIVATVGFGGIATLADNSVANAKVVIQEQAKTPPATTKARKLSPALQAAVDKELAANSEDKE